MQRQNEVIHIEWSEAISDIQLNKCVVANTASDFESKLLDMRHASADFFFVLFSFSLIAIT